MMRIPDGLGLGIDLVEAALGAAIPQLQFLIPHKPA
jgi:hypothetical protein